VRLPDTTQSVTLVIANSTMTFVTSAAIALTYRFEVYDATGARVYQSPAVSGGNGTTSHVVPTQLENDRTYSWQARAEFLGAVSSWTPRSTFMTPAVPTGYISASEIYDPLISGRSIGQVHGPVQFIPGLGAKLLGQDAYISYELPQTLFEGEFSLIVTNLAANTKGGKTKLFAMGKGYGDIVTNEYRMTVEKRGDPPGVVAWRFIARDDQIDTEGPERVTYNFLASQTYFWSATWRANRFTLLINEGGVNGRTIYDHGKTWKGRGYEPNPHVIYVGAPVGRSGLEGASVNDVIIRQVWVSGRPRPGFANQ
jgi:hypothetical protein